MNKLCAPAIIYLLFSITQMLIDTYKGLYNTVGMKAIVTIMVTLLLNILCERGLGVISWIIVFIPFMFMSVIVGILLYVFGLDAATGTLKFKCNDNGTIKTGTSSNSSSSSNESSSSTSSNSSNSGTAMNSNTNISPAPTGTSDPEYN